MPIVYLSSSSSYCISMLFVVHILPCKSSYTLPRSFKISHQQVVSGRPCCPVMMNSRKAKKRSHPVERKRQTQQHQLPVKEWRHSPTRVWKSGSLTGRPSTSGRKWWCPHHLTQIEAIRHTTNTTSMSVEEWRSMEEIARSTIRMHLPKMFISAWQRRQLHSLCGKNYRRCTRRNPPHRS